MLHVVPAELRLRGVTSVSEVQLLLLLFIQSDGNKEVSVI